MSPGGGLLQTDPLNMSRGGLASTAKTFDEKV